MLIVASLFFIAGCGTVPLIEKHQVQLAELEPGLTTLSMFQNILPEAVLRGQNTETGKTVHVYTVNQLEYDPIEGRHIKSELRFYFYDGFLERWGRPQDWPDDSDFILEVRD